MMETTTSHAGTWVTPPVSYVEPLRIHCALCGRPIARRYWQAAPTGEPLVFCDPAHEEKYVSYWLPTHGPNRESEPDVACSPLFGCRIG